MIQNRTGLWKALFLTEIAALYLVGWLLLGPTGKVLPNVSVIENTGNLFLGLGITQTVLCVVWWAVYHRLNYGIKYAVTHARLLGRIRMALLDAGAGFGIEAYSGEIKTLKLPTVRLKLSKDLSSGTVEIRNHIRYQNKLENMNLSSALGRFRVEQSFLSDDENWFIFEIEDAKTDRQLKFDSSKELITYTRQFGDNMLVFDSKNRAPLSSLLLVGTTGSGKTYALYSLILQALSWSIKPNLFFADPKNSSMVVLGNKINSAQSAGSVERIIELLEQFSGLLERRQEELKAKLGEKLDADYREWNLPAQIFILDEYAAFASVVQMMDKQTRDKVNAILRNIVLKGRQLGCFIWIVMQKSDANDLPTAIRDNLPLKICLGMATNTTLMTIFEHAADLPKRKFGLGQGLYTCQGRTRQPQITSFPTLRFDILASLDSDGVSSA